MSNWSVDGSYGKVVGFIEVPIMVLGRICRVSMPRVEGERPKELAEMLRKELKRMMEVDER